MSREGKGRKHPMSIHGAAVGLPEQAGASDIWSEVFTGRITWPADGYLFRQGETPELVFMLEDGFVKLLYLQEDGHESIIDIKHPGALLGTAALMGNTRHQVSAVTGCCSQLRWCSPQNFRKAAEQDPVRLLTLFQSHCAEIQTLTERIILLMVKSSKQRLLRELRDAGKPDASGRLRPLRNRLKHVELASLIGVTPEHLSRLLKEMCDEGTVLRRNGRIVCVTA